MLIVSWNVAGLRAVIRKGFYDFVNTVNPDVICLQEIKATPDQVNLDLPGYEVIWNPAKKSGYAGTLLASKLPIEDRLKGFGYREHSDEGRNIVAEIGGFYIVTAYVPNSKEGLSRLPYRLRWEEDFQDFLHRLDVSKPVILCGDLNVAHKEIDIARPDSNRFSPGFSIEEREAMSRLLASGFVDAYRYQYPEETEAYTYWSYFNKARERNVGWRLDYFVVSERVVDRIYDCDILSHVMGSDHCPIMLDIR